MQAPGQLLKHYAPNLPCYFTTQLAPAYSYDSTNYPLNKCAFISFDPSFAPIAADCPFFFTVGDNLSAEMEEPEEEVFCSREEKARMREVYYLLRKCENLPVEAIVIGWAGVKEGAVWDKVFRSTQGQEAQSAH